MVDKLFKCIEEYNTIIIHRHSRPDGDALGSQFGLALVLKNRFPNKEIYCVGDSSSKYGFFGDVDQISDDKYINALAIVCDVAVKSMVSDDRYLNAKEIFCIDHHENACDFTKNHIVETKRVACAEFIAYLLFNAGYTITQEAATLLYGGIVTDSGRFQFGEKLEDTFLIASKLIACGATPKNIYDNIYVETLEDRQMKNYFSNRFEIKGHVAYLKNTSEVFEKFPKEFNDISRGMLSVMAGIDTITIWLNFTYDASRNIIIGEFRSRNKIIVDIAKKYGGGGHNFACGASLENWDVVDRVIDDFVKLAEEA